MDISETFRPEDLSKTDFFDFVTAPDLGIACDRNDGAGSAEPTSANGTVGNCTGTSSNINNNNNNNSTLQPNNNAINQSSGGGISSANAIGSNDQAALQGFDQVCRRLDIRFVQ